MAEDASKLTPLCDLLEQALTLSKSIHPIPSHELASLRKARRLATTILDAFLVDPVVADINFEGHRTSLSSKLAALQKSCKDDWKFGADIQAEFMYQMCVEIAKWLPNIWRVLEAGADFHLARSCLAYCTEIVLDISKCDTRAEFGDLEIDILIRSGEGQTIHEDNEHILDALEWFWRELLIHDAMNKNAPLSSLVIVDLEKYRLTDQVFALMDPHVSEHEREQPLRNDHWTPDMRTTVEALVYAPRQKRIAHFLKKPSLALYKALVTDALKPSFIEAVREDVSRGRSHISLSDAIEIFRMNGLLDDIVPIAQWTSDDEPLLAIAKTLSGAGASAEHRAVARKVLKEGLAHADRKVIDEIIDRAFPGIEDASDWLDDRVRCKYDCEFLQQNDPVGQDAIILARFADQFVAIAQGDSWHFGPGPYDEPEVYPDFSKNILSWLQVLGEWPDQQEAAAVWDEVKRKTGDDIFGIHGVMSRMALACDKNKHNLAKGIRIEIKTASIPVIYLPTIVALNCFSLWADVVARALCRALSFGAGLPLYIALTDGLWVCQHLPQDYLNACLESQYEAFKLSAIYIHTAPKVSLLHIGTSPSPHMLPFYGVRAAHVHDSVLKSSCTLCRPLWPPYAG